MNRRHVLSVCIGCVVLSLGLQADTIVLRDRRRLQGALISVRDGAVEFETSRGGRDRVRIDRREVVRIELDDDDRPGNGGGSGGGRPPGLRERDVRVDARSGWTNTGVSVRSGQTVYFNASGKVRWGSSRQDGPEGERGSPRNDNRPIPTRPAASLIGRVGEGDEFFFIGDSTGGIRVRSAGRLYLGVNDDFLNDNSGAFSVTVFY